MIWLTRVCQVAWRVGRVPKDCQIDRPHTQKGDRSERTNYRGISLLSLTRRVFAKMPRKQLNQRWMIPSVVLFAAIALQKKFLLSSKFSRNHGNMSKTYTHVLSTSGKYMAGFFMKSFGWCCGSTVLTGASCWPSSNCIPVQKTVSCRRS